MQDDSMYTFATILVIITVVYGREDIIGYYSLYMLYIYRNLPDLFNHS